MVGQKDLSPVETLKNGKEFSSVRNARCYAKTETHTLSIMRAEDSEVKLTGVGIIASKKVGNAVIRNKVRRRFREIARHHKPEIEGLRMVIFAFDTAGMATYSKLESDFLNALKRAKKRLHASSSQKPILPVRNEVFSDT
ncbi:MAG: ribonuclease P protein component [Bifidobacteriaceae bacterium]|jgi:ribonuclease P protein component|nr:ribonuclease P protein component [Bifidobacteriaceae bacterium]